MLPVYHLLLELCYDNSSLLDFVYSKALDLYMAVAILRVKDGLDYSKVLSDETEILNGMDMGNTSILNTRQNSRESIPRNQSYSQMSQGLVLFFIFISV